MEKIKYSMGNKKIGKDTMIINMDSALNCQAGKMGLYPLYDNKKCYAMKAEIQYPSVLPYRKAQAKIWKKLSAHEIVKDILSINKRKRNKIKYLRLNESGDFIDQNDIWKLSIISDLLKDHNIKVYTYTHRKDLDYEGLSSNLTINSSWQDTKIHNRFLSFSKNKIDRIMNIKKDRKIIRCIADCSICNACKTENQLTILCDIH